MLKHLDRISYLQTHGEALSMKQVKIQILENFFPPSSYESGVKKVAIVFSSSTKVTTRTDINQIILNKLKWVTVSFGPFEKGCLRCQSPVSPLTEMTHFPKWPIIELTNFRSGPFSKLWSSKWPFKVTPLFELDHFHWYPGFKRYGSFILD